MIYDAPDTEGFSIPDCDITTLLLDYNLKDCSPDKPAIIDGDDGRTVYTFGSLRGKVVLLAGFLQAQLGIQRGDVVGYLSLNILYYPVLVHAVLATGATLSAFNPVYQPAVRLDPQKQRASLIITYLTRAKLDLKAFDMSTVCGVAAWTLQAKRKANIVQELAHTLSLAKPKFVLVQHELVQNLERAIPLLKTGSPALKIHVLDGESKIYPNHRVNEILGQTKYTQRFRRTCRAPQETASDLAFICFSSGTSGQMKGVKLSHRNVVANVFQQGHCLKDMFTPETVFTLVVPFFHILGLGGFCVQYLCHGAPIVVFKSFNLPKMLNSIGRDRVTHVNVVPPIALAMLQSPLLGTADLSSVKCLMNAAAPLKQNLVDQLCSRMGCVMTQWYGMTEASPSVASQRESEAHVKGTIGKLLPGMQMRIVDGNGEDVQPGERGELCIRGPNIMQGYVEASSQGATLDQGFFATGDVAYVDKDGYIYLVDRLKELIKVKGQQVAPAELESILLTHPSVLDAAVCGVDVAAEATEYPIAYVSIKSDTTMSRDELSESIEKFVADQVAHYKRLVGGVHIIETIPRKLTIISPSGKILRRCLPAKMDRAAVEDMVAQRREKRLRSRI